jgi:hypothetical protein
MYLFTGRLCRSDIYPLDDLTCRSAANRIYVLIPTSPLAFEGFKNVFGREES